MTATESLPLSSIELEYLLLDDLYEALDRPMDWEVQEWELEDSVIPIVEFLLVMEQQREPDADDSAAWSLTVPGGLRQQRDLLYTRLGELRESLESHSCSRSTIEAVRDSVLVWIHRLQKRRRDLHQAGRLTRGADRFVRRPVSQNFHSQLRRSPVPSTE